MIPRTRICLIEIGSYSVRFWVADFDRTWRFWNVEVGDALRDNRHFIDPSAPTKEGVIKLNRIVESLLEQAAVYRCDIVMAFGSAMCRNIESLLPGSLSESIQILTSSQEAMAALAAAGICDRNHRVGGEITVIDEGTGSTQIARGVWQGDYISGIQSTSIDLGSGVLSKIFEENPEEYPNKIQEIIAKLIDDIRKSGISQSKSGVIYLIGGVATKIAWLFVREGQGSYYKPFLVNGKSLNFQRMLSLYGDLIALYKKSPETASQFVDNRPGREDEALRVISGLGYLSFLSYSIGNTSNIKVSSYTIKQGISFLTYQNILS